MIEQADRQEAEHQSVVGPEPIVLVQDDEHQHQKAKRSRHDKLSFGKEFGGKDPVRRGSFDSIYQIVNRKRSPARCPCCADLNHGGADLLIIEMYTCTHEWTAVFRYCRRVFYRAFLTPLICRYIGSCYRKESSTVLSEKCWRSGNRYLRNQIRNVGWSLRLDFQIEVRCARLLFDDSGAEECLETLDSCLTRQSKFRFVAGNTFVGKPTKTAFN